MSLESLDVLRQHRSNQIENSPASELFQIEGGLTFYGVFDDSHIEDNEDDGNIVQKKRAPRIMVSRLPNGLIERASRIIRENGSDTYTFKYVSLDSEGIPLLWLF